MTAMTTPASSPDIPSASTTPAPQPAGIVLRLLALIYDGLLLLAVWMVLSAILVPFGTSSSAAQAHKVMLTSAAWRQFVIFPAMVAVTWLFYGYCWTRTGQTLGMQTWRLQTLRYNGTYLRWSDAIVRCASACLFPIVCGLISEMAWHSPAASAVSMLSGFLGNYLWILWSSHRLAWHDQFSGTLVWKLPPAPAQKGRLLGRLTRKNKT